MHVPFEVYLKLKILPYLFPCRPSSFPIFVAMPEKCSNLLLQEEIFSYYVYLFLDLLLHQDFLSQIISPQQLVFFLAC